MPIKVGIIGLSSSPEAWASTAHAVPLQTEPLSLQYKLTAVATTNAESALKSAKRWEVPSGKAYTNANDIANDADIDLVVVSVKLPLHRDVALPALKSGKDVLVEWPLATDLEQVDELQQAAKLGGGRTFVGLQARTSPTILKAKEIIDSGVLGRIRASTIVALDNVLLALPSRFDYENVAKNRADISTIPAGHILDAQSFLLGEYEHISATSTCFFPEITTSHHSGPVHRDAPDSFLVHGVLLNGAVASASMITSVADTPATFTWEITGEKGALKMQGSSIHIQITPPNLSLFTDGKWEDVPVRSSLAPGQTSEIYVAIAGGEAVPGSLVDFDGAALRHRMLEAAAKSARDGTRQRYL